MKEHINRIGKGFLILISFGLIISVEWLGYVVATLLLSYLLGLIVEMRQ